MSARIVIVDPVRADYRAALGAWADAMRAGAVAAFPTDTVWGIGALAGSAGALERIYALKGRDAQQPIACLVASAEVARKVASEWPPEVAALARSHWPGALTIVTPTAGLPFPAIQRGTPTLGLRVPARRVLLDLLAMLDAPLAATSANRSGEPELEGVQNIGAMLGAGLDLIVDDRGGRMTGQASTVVQWAGDRVRVLRQGAIAIPTPTESDR